MYESMCRQSSQSIELLDDAQEEAVLLSKQRIDMQLQSHSSPEAPRKRSKPEADGTQPTAGSESSGMLSPESAAELVTFLGSLDDATWAPSFSIGAARSSPQPQVPCPICCATAATEPCVNRSCGHICCARCWLSWLQKSKTCPTCRTTASKESVARLSLRASSA